MGSCCCVASSDTTIVHDTPTRKPVLAVLAVLPSKWEGYWLQGSSRGDMVFEKMTVDNGVVEGMGSDGVGEFEIKGTHDKDGVKFVKQYIGKHAVEYEGKFVNEGVIEGKWSIGEGCTGEFKLERV